MAASITQATGEAVDLVKLAKDAGISENVPLTVFIGVSTTRHEMAWLNRFHALIDEIPEILEAYRLTGTVDYILKVVVPDMASYDAVYKRMIERLEFSQINSMISMEELKFTTAIPTKYL